MTWLINTLIVLVGGYVYAIRGGINMPFTNKSYPLNKWWWAIYVCLLSGILVGWNWKLQLTAFIAGKTCTACCGWGRYLGAIISGVINWDDKDNLNINDIIDNLKIKIKGNVYWLKDFPRLYGIVGMSLRGGLLTFILGLCFHSMLYMCVGLSLGIVYWIATYINKLYDLGRGGWTWGEICTGMLLSLFACICW